MSSRGLGTRSSKTTQNTRCLGIFFGSCE
ncbi:MAG TPA: palindromic element RPE4 domain-containing protein [Rickettsia endosymbiont of Ceroptres masudai]|nr:palindromic element RPE4 domain-containing protein [Rickettsia endosymbiont of Ceroptres masudai]